jgi:hypothetical protein
MEYNLFRYIWRNSWRDQSAILVVVAISYVFYFVSLDLPKQIVNQAIQGGAFKGGRTTAAFLDLSIGPIDWLGLPQITLFHGFDLAKVPYLVALCFSFLFFVVVNGWMKQLVNTEKGAPWRAHAAPPTSSMTDTRSHPLPQGQTAEVATTRTRWSRWAASSAMPTSRRRSWAARR